MTPTPENRIELVVIELNNSNSTHTGEIRICNQFIHVLSKNVQMFGEISLLRYATISFVQHPGGRFLQQRRELARIVQDRYGIPPEAIVPVLVHFVGGPYAGEVHLILVAHERRNVPVHVEGSENRNEEDADVS